MFTMWGIMAAEVLLSGIDEREGGIEHYKANMLCSMQYLTTLLCRGKMSITLGLAALSWLLLTLTTSLHILSLNYFTLWILPHMAHFTMHCILNDFICDKQNNLNWTWIFILFTGVILLKLSLVMLVALEEVAGKCINNINLTLCEASSSADDLMQASHKFTRIQRLGCTCSQYK